ncbi:MAG: hypothetical protein M3483_05380 [Gemmatimonadota bacterium]|nr:hypothetical protein [Gemmatimonadota bacterium]
MVARKKKFLAAEFADRFRESYAALTNDRQKGVDKVILALMKQEPTPGMRIKPIQPEKYYYEARINAGDRLVFRLDDAGVRFVDVVQHDDIDRFGRKVRNLL